MGLAIDLLGIGIESSYGVSISPTEYTPVRAIRPDISENKQILNNSILSRKGGLLSKSTNKTINGDFSFYGYPDNIGYWLYGTFGQVSSALVSGEASVYQHTFTQVGSLPSFTFTLNEQVGYRELSGVLIDTLSLDFVDGIMHGSTAFIAKDSSTPTETTTVLNESLTTTPTGTLGGDATYDAVNDWILLTDALGGQAGQYYFTSSLGTNFDIYFDFWTGNGTGADAVWFFWGCSDVVTSEEIGSAGATKGGYVVTADEYTDNEFEIQFNGVSLQNSTDDGIDIDDGTWRTMYVKVRGNTISLYVDNVLVNSYTDITRSLGGNYWGWGSRTGGSDNEHRIKNLQVSTLEFYFASESDSLVDPFTFPNAKIYIGSSIANALVSGEVKVDEVELTYKNTIVPTAHIGSRTISQGKPSKLGINGIVRRYTNDNIMETYVENNTEKALVLEWTGSSIGNSSNYSLQIRLPKVIMSKIVRPYEVGEQLMEEIVFEPLLDNSLGYSAQALLTNSVSSYV